MHSHEGLLVVHVFFSVYENNTKISCMLGRGGCRYWTTPYIITASAEEVMFWYRSVCLGVSVYRTPQKVTNVF